MGNIIIIAVFAVIIVLSVRAAVKHSKSEGCCCGGVFDYKVVSIF